MKQIISVLVENQAGALNKITGLFARRAFNIDSLAVGVTEDKSISRITMIVDSGNSVVEQVEKQLNKLVNVIKVRSFNASEVVGKELAMIKIASGSKARSEIKDLADIMEARIIDISTSTITLEISDTPERIDLFEEMVRPYGIQEIARTGIIALQKGSSAIS
ncbi:MAG: acetolactate synthase small subunit [Firmicutes bacterium]|nr:acetolactate synthase small subunit [Bacillota bacterium]